MVVVCVCVVVAVAVVVVVVCVAWCGMLKTSMCRFKTPPCVHSKRPCVYRHHAYMLKHMYALCSSNHSRYLVKLFNSSSPEGHCGGNQLLGGSVFISLLSPCVSKYLHVSIATPPGFPLTLRFSGLVHHPNKTKKNKLYIYIFVFVYVHISLYIKIFVNYCIL